MPSKDSADLLWDDINRPKFYSLLSLASGAIRLVLYPAALVKTRLQAAGGGGGGGSVAQHAAAPSLALPGAGAPRAAAAAAASSASAVPRYSSTANAFATIVRTEGKLALYRGFRMNVVGLTCDPVVIGFIEWTRTRLTYYSEHASPLDERNYSGLFFKHVLSPTTAITLVCAGSAACLGQIIQVPVDVVSQKKMMQMHPLLDSSGKYRPAPHTSSLSIARQIVNQEGWRGLYRGFGVTLGVAIPFTALLWAVYWPAQKAIGRLLSPTHAIPSDVVPRTHTGVRTPDAFAQTVPTPMGFPMTPRGGKAPPAHLHMERMPHGATLPLEERRYMEEELRHEQMRQMRDAAGLPKHPVSNGWFSFNWRDAAPAPMAAFIASSSASLATQPIDVIKTRLQVQGGVGATISSTVRHLLAERGVAGLASGWYSRILVVAPQATIMMSAVEALKRYSAK